MKIYQALQVYFWSYLSTSNNRLKYTFHFNHFKVIKGHSFNDFVVVGLDKNMQR